MERQHEINCDTQVVLTILSSIYPILSQFTTNIAHFHLLYFEMYLIAHANPLSNWGEHATLARKMKVPKSLINSP